MECLVIATCCAYLNIQYTFFFPLNFSFLLSEIASFCCQKATEQIMCASFTLIYLNNFKDTTYARSDYQNQKSICYNV